MTSATYAAAAKWFLNRDRGGSRVSYSRKAILARWRGLCAYCDAPAEHLDHVTPLSRGGRDEPTNIVPACAACNLSKADHTLAEWAATF